MWGKNPEDKYSIMKLKSLLGIKYVHFFLKVFKIFHSMSCLLSNVRGAHESAGGSLCKVYVIVQF